MDYPVIVRKAAPDDLAGITAIQEVSLPATSWTPRSYLDHDCHVAIADRSVAGFLVSRQTAPGEREILNLAVDPVRRRRGIGRRLLEHELSRGRGAWFLEVRESNFGALSLYRGLGFQAAGRREGYYHDPAEAAIVLRIIS